MSAREGAPLHVVVTGPSRGIGRATAVAFAARGARLSLLGRASAAFDSVVQEAVELGAEARAYRCDVQREEDVDDAARALLEAWGAPDVVVNNAGIVRRGALVEETEVAAFDEVIAVNLRAPFLVSRALVPAMRARGRGRLVHVASISSTIACPRNASYAASKWGLLGFAKSLAEELRGSGVVSVCILPGSVDTEMLKGSGFPPQMSPQDVAHAIAWLALEAPTAVHGTALEMFG